MKKVIISTMHRGYNYGSALQVFALQKAIENAGYAAKVLDYIPVQCNFKNNITELLNNFFKGSIYANVRALLLLYNIPNL